ncbi:hypothetical protein GQ44DRAFT_755164 [Phaeosphaeriaceae sp. PMI808]|nr:hypothetical protein GQ44DRAFT_755164 [Phaeosphaeriaceae sp. PMI808]
MLTSSNFFDKAVVQQLRALDQQQSYNLLRNFWPDRNHNTSAFDSPSCRAIIEHIACELDQVRYHRDLFAVQDFDTTFVIVQILRENPSMSYEDLIRALLLRFPGNTTDAIRRSVEISVRLWLTINIHTFDIFVGLISAGDTPLNWARDMSLEQVIRGHFGRCVQLQRQRQTTKFDPAFTATYLVNICGMRVRWTNDIGNHLAFDPQHCVLTVYRHKACLISLLDTPQSNLILADVLEEMLDTMDLLFPPWNATTKQLLLKEGQSSL